MKKKCRDPVCRLCQSERIEECIYVFMKVRKRVHEMKRMYCHVDSILIRRITVSNAQS